MTADTGLALETRLGANLIKRLGRAGESVEAAIHTELGESIPVPARVELRCTCGYGIVAVLPPPPCPMCAANLWKSSRVRSGATSESVLAQIGTPFPLAPTRVRGR